MGNLNTRFEHIHFPPLPPHMYILTETYIKLNCQVVSANSTESIHYYEPLLSGSHFNMNHTKKIFKSYLHYSADTLKRKEKVDINKLYGKTLNCQKRILAHITKNIFI